jgi:hypothetical protein
MKRIITIVYIISATLLMAPSCSKSFLDVPVAQQKIAEDYIVDLTTAEELLNGILFMVARDVYEANHVTYADMVADNVRPLGSTLLSQYNWSQVATEGDGSADNMNGLWVASYNAIKVCNLLLEKVALYQQEDMNKANAIKGQAYVVRALLYHNLVNTFAQPYHFSGNAAHAGVPYVTGYKLEKNIKREAVSVIYNHMIADLTKGIDLIPASIKNKSSVTRDAAKGLLARVLLYKKDYARALTLAVEVCAAIPLMPAADYPAKLYTAADNESIFWLAPAKANIGYTDFQGYNFSRVDRFSATADLVNVIKERPNDSRNKWFAVVSGFWQVKKFPKSVVAGAFSFPEWSYYQTVIRSSELFLTAAECFAETGKNDSAQVYLDKVRKRADPTAPASLAVGSALLDSIYKERRKELCFENMRLYDLLRTGKSVQRVDVNSPSPALLPYPSNKAIAPIPLLDVIAYSLSQNPGYE